MRTAHRTNAYLRSEEWLLVEWPESDVEPAKYWFATGPDNATLVELVFVAKMRWRIERDYQDLKQEFGLSNYEGRNWTGFHHHATMCIAAYAFLMYQRLRYGGVKKNSVWTEMPKLPKDYLPRGQPAYTTACSGFDSNVTSTHLTYHRSNTNTMPVLLAGCQQGKFVTQ